MALFKFSKKKTFIKEHYVGLNQCLPLLYPHNLLERKNEVKMRKNSAAGEAEKKMIQLIRAVFAFKIILKYYSYKYIYNINIDLTCSFFQSYIMNTKHFQYSKFKKLIKHCI